MALVQVRAASAYRGCMLKELFYWSSGTRSVDKPHAVVGGSALTS